MSRLGRVSLLASSAALLLAFAESATAVETKKPDANAQHWRNGEVRWLQRWVRFDELPSDIARALAFYEKTRDAYPTTVEGRLALADWCAKHRLADQERAHLTQVLELEPDHAAARARLGFVPVNDGWMSKHELELAAKQDRQDALDARRWDPKTAEWRKAIQRGTPAMKKTALERVRAVKDSAAALSLERQVSTVDDEAAGKAVVDALALMEGDAATYSLVRHAMFHTSAVVRTDAAQALKTRPLESYVPQLLGVMYTPVELQTQEMQTGAGMVIVQTMKREGRSQFQEKTIKTNIQTDDEEESNALGEELARLTREKNEQLVQEENARTELINSRATDVLALVSDKKLPPEPTAWWTWWRTKNDVYTAKKPTRRRYETEDQYVESPQEPEVFELDCLAAGTIVWTAVGPKAIEKMQVGDLVLSQNPETGELAFKPVLMTTVRPTSRLTRFEIGGEVLRTSGGHPLWIEGRGWTKAREAKAGDAFHGLDGQAVISSTQRDVEAETYNLVVADFHTYFIGPSRILNHDNTTALPTKNKQLGAK